MAEHQVHLRLVVDGAEVSITRQVRAISEAMAIAKATFRAANCFTNLEQIKAANCVVLDANNNERSRSSGYKS
jgi:hypothetical protein